MDWEERSRSNEQTVLKQEFQQQVEPKEIKKTMSVQTQELPKKRPRLKKQPSIQSTKSIGVGSQNINDSFHTQTSQGLQSVTKNHSKVLSQQDIQSQIMKKVIKRNFQSSEDEKKQKQKFRQMEASPDPVYMKAEVHLIKMEESRVEQKSKIDDRKSVEMIFTPKQRDLLIQTQTNQRYEIQGSQSSDQDRNVLPINNPYIASGTFVRSKKSPVAFMKSNMEQPHGNVNSIVKSEHQKNDIDEFYQALLKNTSITCIQDGQDSAKNAHKKEADPIDFCPDDEINSHFKSFYSHRQDSLLNSLVEEFENYENISEISWIKPPVHQQSNVLDKGQFIQNSQASIQNVSMQKPLSSVARNTSLAHFNIQYQSDQEIESTTMKKDMLSSLKRKPLLPQPQLQRSLLNMKSTQAQDEQKKDITEEEESKEDRKNNDPIRQQQMIDLFKEDAESKRPSIERPVQEEAKQGETFPEFNLTTQSHFEIFIDDAPDEKPQNMSNQEASSPKVAQNTVSQGHSGHMKILSIDTTENNLKRQNKKKNNRYDDQEDSLINFDVSQTNMEGTPRVEGLEKSVEQTREITKQPSMESKTKKPVIKNQVEILPLVILSPDYIECFIDGWEEKREPNKEEYNLDEVMIQKLAVNFLGEKSKTKKTLEDKLNQKAMILKADDDNSKIMSMAAVASGAPEQKELVSEAKGQSQESIIQELDSISRIYNELETVQEEDWEKTATIDNQVVEIENSKISVKANQRQDDEEEKDKQQHSARYSEEQHSPVKQSKTSNEKSGGRYGQQQEEMKLMPSPKQKRYKNLPKVSSSQSSDKERVQTKEEKQEVPASMFYRQNERGQQPTQGEQLPQQDQEDMVSMMAPHNLHNDKYNRSVTNALLYNIYTSSEDESKKKGTYSRNKVLNQKKMMLHQSVNAQYMQQQSLVGSLQQQELLAKKKAMKDVSFKSSNMSTHTDQGERLKENLRMFTKNRLGLSRDKSREKSRENSASRPNQ